ncbi:hypothetical protein [Spirosoma luteum]
MTIPPKKAAAMRKPCWLALFWLLLLTKPAMPYRQSTGAHPAGHDTGD